MTLGRPPSILYMHLDRLGHEDIIEILTLSSWWGKEERFGGANVQEL